jgi:DNA repair ATPase RecN
VIEQLPVREFETLCRSTEQLLGQVQAHQQVLARLETEVQGLEAESTVLGLTSTAIQTLLNHVSVESMEAVETLVSYGLRVIFEDQALAFRMGAETKRGVQWMEPRLVQGDIDAPILDSFGGGPASVVAFLLRVLACRRLGLAPVILLDESFAMVSENYVPNVAKLLRELADTMGYTILLVTHQPAFLAYATRAYEAAESGDGTVFRSVERRDGVVG